MHKQIFYQAKKIALKWFNYLIELQPQKAYVNLTSNNCSMTVIKGGNNFKVNLSLDEGILLLDYLEFLLLQNNGKKIFYNYQNQIYQLTLNFFIDVKDISILITISQPPISHPIQISMALLPQQRQIIQNAVSKKSALILIDSEIFDAIGLAEQILKQWQLTNKSYLAIVDTPYFKNYHPQTLLHPYRGYDIEKALISASRSDLDAILIIGCSLKNLSEKSLILIDKLASNKNVVLIGENISETFNNKYEYYNLNIKIEKIPQLCIRCKKPVNKININELEFDPSAIYKDFNKKLINIYQSDGCESCNFSGFLGECYLISSQDDSHSIPLENVKIFKGILGLIPLEKTKI